MSFSSRLVGAWTLAVLAAFTLVAAPSIARGEAHGADAAIAHAGRDASKPDDAGDAESAIAPVGAADASDAAVVAPDAAETDAQKQREDSLQAAQSAHSDAAKAVADETARLIGVEHAQHDFDQQLAEERSATADRREVTLGWEQRSLDAQAKGNGTSADHLYDDLRRALRSARDDLSTALSRLADAKTNVPTAGDDRLSSLRVDIDTTAARAERDKVDAEATRLETAALEVRRAQAAQLYDEVGTLNRERLALLDALTPGTRDAVTGFTFAGWDQASAEVRQLTLIFRYHAFVIRQWIPTLRHPTVAFGRGVVGGALDVFEWLLVLIGFVWWRRRSATVLRAWRVHAHAEDRLTRQTGASLTTRAAIFLEKIHRPAEWLVLLDVLHHLLPAETTAILEARLVSALLSWIFGAALVVDIVNALADSDASHAPREVTDTSALRLQSLRLVARVIVVVGLVLAISSMLVGRGTIFDWVSSTCWLASLPVLLVLVYRWRPIVFERAGRARKPKPIQRWVLANQHGWSSFVAAMVGGVYLFVSGVVRGARAWVGRFDLTRRALAYLFRRQLDKRGAQANAEQTAPLVGQLYVSLGPEVVPSSPIARDADEALDRLAARIRDHRGGVIAIVGERGIGKSTALRHLLAQEGCRDAVVLDAKPIDLEALRADLAVATKAPAGSSLEECATQVDASETRHAILIDDAHHFVQPIMGGLATFDTLLAIASRHAQATTWVFAIDLVVWQFLERARSTRPLFDDVIRLGPWREEEIVTLLETRTESAGLSPSFDSLLDRLPANADEIDRHDALVQRAADYYRLLWDYAAGNPGVALHMWRRSLGIDAAGNTAVRLFDALDTSDLERLPDSTIFVLRAVLQMSSVAVSAIGHATRLRSSEVTDALRYLIARGYVEESGPGYRITWTWFRAITQFLQRRHLLVTR